MGVARMLRRIGIVFVVAVIMVGAKDTPARATAQSGTCDVKITAPKAGDQVPRSGEVTGTAKIPPGTYLWVLAHMKALAAEWWPQGNRPALIESDGKWIIVAGYGQPEDVNRDFEVAAVVVNSGTNDMLRRWVANAKEKNRYDPIEFPPAVDGCVPLRITVKKSAH